MASNSKSLLRDQIRLRLLQMKPEQRASDSLLACSFLEKQAVWREAKSILFYAPLRLELDIWPLLKDCLEAGKTVALPRFEPTLQQYTACRLEDLPRDLVTGQFGIREPAQHCADLAIEGVRLVLVPGLAFDKTGRRLGRGKGYYDRLLAQARGRTCGVAFDQQLIGEIPVEDHDRRVEFLLTPTQWLECEPGQ